MLIKILLAIIGLAYVVSPYDLFPDFFVGFGWIDDIIVLILLWKLYKYFIRRRYDYSQEYTQNSSREKKEDRFSGNGKDKQTKYEFNQKDPYEVLGIDKKASPEEIKNAYRLLVSKYHPDKVAYLGEEFRVLAEQRFKDIQEAYHKLKVR